MFRRYGSPTIYLLVVFACGLAVGALGYRFYQLKTVTASAAPSRPSPKEWKKKHIAELNTRLHLTAEQTSQISAILDDAHKDIRAVMKTVEPEMDRIQQTQYAKVKAALTPEQAAEYEKFHQERIRKRALGHRE